MNSKKFHTYLIPTAILLFLSLVSCSNEAKEEARKLNNQAAKMPEQSNDSAMLLLDSSLAIDSTNPAVYFNRVGILMKAEKYKEAIKELVAIEKLEPTNAEAIVFQGLLYEKINNKPAALVKYNRGAELTAMKTKNLSPQDEAFKFYTTMNGVYMRLAEHEAEGKAILQSQLTQDPNNQITKEFLSKSRTELIQLMLSQP